MSALRVLPPRPVILRRLGDVLPEMAHRWAEMPPGDPLWQRLVETPAPFVRVYLPGGWRVVEGCFADDRVLEAVDRLLGEALFDRRVLWRRGGEVDRPRVRTALLRLDRRAERRARRRRRGAF